MAWVVLLPAGSLLSVVRKPSHLLTREEEMISVADAKVMGFWGEVEAGLYKGLSPEGSAEALKVH
jgi:hypothetical protein